MPNGICKTRLHDFKNLLQVTDPLQKKKKSTGGDTRIKKHWNLDFIFISEEIEQAHANLIYKLFMLV